MMNILKLDKEDSADIKPIIQDVIETIKDATDPKGIEDEEESTAELKTSDISSSSTTDNVKAIIEEEEEKDLQKDEGQESEMFDQAATVTDNIIGKQTSESTDVSKKTHSGGEAEMHSPSDVAKTELKEAVPKPDEKKESSEEKGAEKAGALEKDSKASTPTKSVQTFEDTPSTLTQGQNKEGDEILVASHDSHKEEALQDREVKVVTTDDEQKEKEKDDTHVAELTKEQKMEKEHEKEYTYEAEGGKVKKEDLNMYEGEASVCQGKDNIAAEAVVTEKEKYDPHDVDCTKEEKWEKEEIQEKDKTIKQAASEQPVIPSKPAFMVVSSDEDREEEEEEDICMGGAGSRPLSVEPKQPEHDSAESLSFETSQKVASEKTQDIPLKTAVTIPTLTMQEPSVDEDVKEFGKGIKRCTRNDTNFWKLKLALHHLPCQPVQLH